MQRELTYAQAVLETSENTAIKRHEYSHQKVKPVTFTVCAAGVANSIMSDICLTGPL